MRLQKCPPADLRQCHCSGRRRHCLRLRHLGAALRRQTRQCRFSTRLHQHQSRSRGGGVGQRGKVRISAFPSARQGEHQCRQWWPSKLRRILSHRIGRRGQPGGGPRADHQAEGRLCHLRLRLRSAGPAGGEGALAAEAEVKRPPPGRPGDDGHQRGLGFLRRRHCRRLGDHRRGGE